MRYQAALRPEKGRILHQRQTNAETQDQGGTECDLLQLQAEQQHGDGGRTGNQPASQPEDDDLTGGHFAVGEAAPNVVGVGQFMRVLVARRRHIQSLVVLDRMMMVRVLDVLDVIVVAVVFIAQAQAGNEFVRLGNLLLRLDKAIALHEAEALATAVCPFRLNAHLFGCPQVAVPAFAKQPEARRHSLFKDVQPDYSVACIDALALIMMVVVFVVLMGMLRRAAAARFATSSSRLRQR
jgi:hypothetical protein